MDPISGNAMQPEHSETIASQDASLQSKPGALGGTVNPSSLQDRVFTAIFQSVLPTQYTSSIPEKPVTASKKTPDRPNFSLPIMSNNFRRFNARIGVVFVFQAKASRLFSWKYPSHTLSFLAVYTLCCLNPALLTILPLAVCLFSVMVPAFSVRHPPPPNSQLIDTHAGQGPASAPPANIKPAPDMSKAFFRNMRDLQNCMEDFSVVHDQLVGSIAPVTNFSDERLSSTLFLGLFSTTCMLFVTSFVLPLKVLSLILGWMAIGASHPVIAEFIRTLDRSFIKQVARHVQASVVKWAAEDIALDEAPELREVEVFEVQRQVHEEYWEPWVYSVSPYDPQSPLRISGATPHGSRYFEDVQPPKGWEWSDKKWSLDLLSQEWIEERMITAVEVETDGERWVYDMAVSLLPDYEGDKESSEPRTPRKRADRQEDVGERPKGEWRRRRWVRIVKRQTLKDIVNRT